MRNIYSIKKRLIEVKKCQHLCAKCHLETTLERGNFKTTMTNSQKKKMDYVYLLKKDGCKECGYQNNDLMKFFEFDHIEPKNKVNNICTMVHCAKYSLSDIKKEIEKCRILCRHCHLISTNIQMKNGLFNISCETFICTESTTDC